MGLEEDAVYSQVPFGVSLKKATDGGITVRHSLLTRSRLYRNLWKGPNTRKVLEATVYGSHPWRLDLLQGKGPSVSVFGVVARNNYEEVSVSDPVSYTALPVRMSSEPCL